MTEDEARHWLRERFGEAGEARMDILAGLVAGEAVSQNLVARPPLRPCGPATSWILPSSSVLRQNPRVTGSILGQVPAFRGW